MSLICWVVTDGKVGMENQCVAVARRLGLDPVIKRVKMRAPWKQLSPWGLRIGNRWSLSPKGDQLDGPLPDILIATGRHSVTSSLAVRDMTEGKCLRVQIQNPGVDPSNFDLVVVPRHDRLSGPNVLVTRGAPHGVTAEGLAAAKEKFAPRLAHLPQPRIAVLLGGNNGVYKFTPLAAQKLAECLSTLARGNHGSVMVTASRRTGAAIEALFKARLTGVAGEFWDGTGDNPYLGYLAYADHIVVTADSVNMVCEAASTGKPVHVVPLDGGSDKFRRFHDGLVEDGITRPFHGMLESWSYPTFDDAGMVAERIRTMLR
ncbi:MAG TPA: mitochondrial fission ELM1 family protein [Magnetospirillaceae bacterium]|nr:mitochondrial fission ELM1 family protein [Magnetospirillaceae bacterium]